MRILEYIGPDTSRVTKSYRNVAEAITAAVLPVRALLIAARRSIVKWQAATADGAHATNPFSRGARCRNA